MESTNNKTSYSLSFSLIRSLSLSYSKMYTLYYLFFNCCQLFFAFSLFSPFLFYLCFAVGLFHNFVHFHATPTCIFFSSVNKQTVMLSMLREPASSGLMTTKIWVVELIADRNERRFILEVEIESWIKPPPHTKVVRTWPVKRSVE